MALCILLHIFIVPIPLWSSALTAGLSSRGSFKRSEPDPSSNYVLALSYMDQFTWAATRLRSLQCWTSRWDGSFRVVEPFLIGTHLGAPVEASIGAFDLKFSDAVDIQTWNNYGSTWNLASWQEFVSQNVSRNVILVQIIYAKDDHCPENAFSSEVCDFKKLKTFWSQILAPKSFKLLKEVCINFHLHGFHTANQFNSLIFQDIPLNVPVTIVIDEWRGMYPNESTGHYDSFVRLRDTECSPMTRENMDLVQHSLSLSEKVISSANDFISRRFSAKTGYTAVVIRWEKVLLFDFYYGGKHNSGSKCVEKIKYHLKRLAENGIGTTFLSTDIGKYGSETFSLYNSTRTSLPSIVSYTEELLTFMHEKPMTLGEYDKMLEDNSGSTNPTIVSQFQKSVAVRAECLVLVGWGTFQEHTRKLYQKQPKKGYCHEPVMIEKC